MFISRDTLVLCLARYVVGNLLPSVSAGRLRVSLNCGLQCLLLELRPAAGLLAHTDSSRVSCFCFTLYSVDGCLVICGLVKHPVRSLLQLRGHVCDFLYITIHQLRYYFPPIASTTGVLFHQPYEIVKIVVSPKTPRYRRGR
uniref:Putative secreted peptide n=1 Tax=Anopheles braziliensis TaxID=58242 RepID=A0A2M3ZNY0_9DIPT